MGIHFGTIVARGWRTRGLNVAFGSLRPFGPGSNVARGSSVGSLTNQEIMSHLYIHFGTIVARGSRTHSSNVAFGSLRPFGPGSNVARGSNVAFGPLRPFGPGSNVARGWRICG